MGITDFLLGLGIMGPMIILNILSQIQMLVFVTK